MNIRYTLVPWVFNKALWAQVISSAAREFGASDLAQMLDVDEKTVGNWSRIDHRQQHHWPAMHNFMAVVNLLDLNPSDFFVLPEK